jgi:hypothetical protein
MSSHTPAIPNQLSSYLFYHTKINNILTRKYFVRYNFFIKLRLKKAQPNNCSSLLLCLPASPSKQSTKLKLLLFILEVMPKKFQIFKKHFNTYFFRIDHSSLL